MTVFAPDYSISRPLEGAKLRVLSLGGGVQSSVLALMGARGDLPRPDAAVFADTGWEPKEVYRWLDWLETQLPYPLIRVSKPGLDLGHLCIAVANGERSREGAELPPFFTKDPEGQAPKQCNGGFKRDVVTRQLRVMLDDAPKGVPVVENWMGISTDEIQRLKNHRRKYVHNRWPLIEFRMSRHDCLRWMEDRQYPRPPKSSCIFCPYRTNAQWRDLRDNHPEDWALAVTFDEAIRSSFERGTAYVHRQRVPLALADLSSGEAIGGFLDECDGVCGV